MGHNIDLFGIEQGLPEEHRMVAEMLRKYLREQILPKVPDWDRKEKSVPIRVLRELIAKTGLSGVGFSGTYGGHEFLGMDYLMKGVVMREIEAIDSGLRSIFSVQNSLVMMPIYWYGTEEQKHKWLPKLATFAKVGAYGQTEPNAGSDPGSMTTKAVRDGDAYVLNGSKAWITNAPIAHVFVIWAKDEEGKIGAYLVERNTPGFSVERVAKWSLRLSATGHLSFVNCRIPLANKLPGAKGLGSAFKCLNEARYGIAWGSTGVLRSCLEEVIPYASTRTQFGKPLVAHDTQRKRIAEAVADYNQLLLLVREVARVADREGSLVPGRHLVSMAKWQASEKARAHAAELMLILGGNLAAFDYHTQRHARNLHVVWTYEGTGDIHRKLLAEYVTGYPAFPRG
ncbi:MAG: acyl-CoA dehydrogenase family protein [bacterium]|nr:acyl-CoA dehydrogenase family protein [bacterium]